jgi:hypothetical protein
MAGNDGGEMVSRLRESLSHMFQPEFQAQLHPETLAALRIAVLDGVWSAFFIVALICSAGVIMGVFLPKDAD